MDGIDGGHGERFFEACETGKGWNVVAEYCTEDATFAAQAEPLADVKDLQGYTEWMKGLMALMPDGSYDLKAFGTDDERESVVAYAVFSGTHTGEGGPVPPTGNHVNSDYVYVMNFDGDKIGHMTKIWHAGIAMRELGWAKPGRPIELAPSTGRAVCGSQARRGSSSVAGGLWWHADRDEAPKDRSTRVECRTDGWRHRVRQERRPAA